MTFWFWGGPSKSKTTTRENALLAFDDERNEDDAPVRIQESKKFNKAQSKLLNKLKKQKTEKANLEAQQPRSTCFCLWIVFRTNNVEVVMEGKMGFNMNNKTGEITSRRVEFAVFAPSRTDSEAFRKAMQELTTNPSDPLDESRFIHGNE